VSGPTIAILAERRHLKIFGVRILLAILAEIAALRVFGELRGRRLRPSSAVTAAAFLVPPAVGFAAACILWIGEYLDWVWGDGGAVSFEEFALGGAMILFGILAGALTGVLAAGAERRSRARE
jgi:hypothetical protein